MACTSTCRTAETGASGCRRGCGTGLRGVAALLEPDLAGYALIGAQLEMLANLGTRARPRL